MNTSTGTPDGKSENPSPKARRTAKHPGSARVTAGWPESSQVSRWSPEARRVGVAILGVLGGASTPSDAARALTVSLPRYYALEQRALQGLLAACEPRAKGRAPSPEKQMEGILRENERLQREYARSQALVRVAQRAAGLSHPKPPEPTPGKRRRNRKPVVRALRMAEALKEAPMPAEDPAGLS